MPRLPRALTRALTVAAVLSTVATASDAAVAMEDDGRTMQTDSALLAQARSGDAAASETLFALALTQALRGREGNLAVSPASIFDALARLAPGARGETAVQLAHALHSDLAANRLLADVATLDEELNGTDAALRVANAGWVQQDFAVRQEYAALLASAGSPLRSTDLAGDPAGSAAAINQWVSEHTNGRIRNILSSRDLGPDSRLVLANAIALDVRWQWPFPVSATADAPFHAPQGVRRVPTMHLGASFDYLEGDGFRALRLPYQGGRLDALVVLPDDGADPLAALPAVTATGVHDGFTSTRVDLALPKFDVDFDLDLHEPLSALGLGALFTGPDLSGIGGAPGELYVSVARHRAWLAVDETTTKGAAATLFVGATSSLRYVSPPVDFTVDRPFLFVVEDHEHGVPLFVARVTDPAD